MLLELVLEVDSATVLEDSLDTVDELLTLLMLLDDTLEELGVEEDEAEEKLDIDDSVDELIVDTLDELWVDIDDVDDGVADEVLDSDDVDDDDGDDDDDDTDDTVLVDDEDIVDSEDTDDEDAVDLLDSVDVDDEDDDE